MDLFVTLVIKLLDGLVLIIIVDALLSWFQGNELAMKARRLTSTVTDLLYAPIHMVVRPVIAGLDLTPIVVIVILNLLSGALTGALAT